MLKYTQRQHIQTVFGYTSKQTKDSNPDSHASKCAKMGKIITGPNRETFIYHISAPWCLLRRSTATFWHINQLLWDSDGDASHHKPHSLTVRAAVDRTCSGTITQRRKSRLVMTGSGLQHAKPAKFETTSVPSSLFSAFHLPQTRATYLSVFSHFRVLEVFENRIWIYGVCCQQLFFYCRLELIKFTGKAEEATEALMLCVSRTTDGQSGARLTKSHWFAIFLIGPRSERVCGGEWNKSWEQINTDFFLWIVWISVECFEFQCRLT